jgi:hypothetical protein
VLKKIRSGRFSHNHWLPKQELGARLFIFGCFKEYDGKNRERINVRMIDRFRDWNLHQSNRKRIEFTQSSLYPEGVSKKSNHCSKVLCRDTHRDLKTIAVV